MQQVARMKQKKMPLVILEPEHAHGKGIYSNMNFDYGQLIKGSPLYTPSINIGKPPHFDGTRYTDWSYKMKMHLIAARL